MDMKQNRKLRVLFVCLGNICRSPMAEAVFRQMVIEAGLSDGVEIGSAATSPWEVGKPPHPGTRAVLRQHNVPIDPAKRSVQIRGADLDGVDYLIGMDYENLVDLRRLSDGKTHVYRLMEFAGPDYPADVPDPYYDGTFEYVFELVEAGCRGLLQKISLANA